MDDMTAFERQIGDELRHEIGSLPRFDAMEIVRTTTQSPKWRFQSMFSATKFVAAGVIVALFGGFLLTGVLMRSPGEVTPAAIGSASPEASPSTLFQLPAEVPEGIESGTIDTPLGKARWVHLTGNRKTLPILVDVERVMAWPSGIAVFEPPDTDGRPSRLWVSADGVEWRLEPLPIPEDAYWASLSHVDGVYWLVANVQSGDRLWRSTDGLTWDEFDPSGLAPAGPLDPGSPAGHGWQMEYSPPVTSGDLTLMVVSHSGSSIPRDRVLVLGDGEVTSVDSPWSAGHRKVQLFGAEDGVYAYVHGSGREVAEMSVWHTSDGHSWSDLGPPTFLDGAPATNFRYFTTLPGSLAVSVFDTPDDGSQSGSDAAWETTDGVSWSPVGPEGRPEGTHVTRLESGWFASDGDIGGPLWGDELWAYIGDSWVSLAEMGIEKPGDGCVVFKRALGNTTLFESGSCQGPRNVRDLWVLTLDPAV